MALSNGPQHDTGDALTETARQIPPGQMDWLQHADEVGDGKLGDQPIANGRKDVRLERADPVRRGTRTAPARSPQRMHPAGRLGKRRNGLAPSNLERVVTGTHRTAIGKRSVPSRTKRYTRIAPETRGAATTADSDTLRPVAAPGGAHAQIEPVPIVVLARTDNGVDEQGSQARARRSHGKRSPNSPPTRRRKALRICGRGATVPEGPADRK